MTNTTHTFAHGFPNGERADDEFLSEVIEFSEAILNEGVPETETDPLELSAERLQKAVFSAFEALQPRSASSGAEPEPIEFEPVFDATESSASSSLG